MSVRVIIIFRYVGETDADDGGDVARNIGERVNTVRNQGMRICNNADATFYASENDVNAET
jgi:hypothetical protein